MAVETDQIPQQEELSTNSIVGDDLGNYTPEQVDLYNPLTHEVKMPDNGRHFSATKQYYDEIAELEVLTLDQEIALSKTIQKGIAAADALPSVESKIELIQKRADIEAGKQAEHELTVHNLRLVFSIARKYVGRGLDFLDLVQEGNFALMDAVKGFDYRKGVKFSDYAGKIIRRELYKAIVEQRTAIRVPSDQRRNRVRKPKILAGSSPTVLSEKEGDKGTAQENTVFEEHSAQPISVDVISLSEQVFSDSDKVVEDTISDCDDNDDIIVNNILIFQMANIAWDVWDQRQREVMEGRYGLHGVPVQTRDKIGERLHTTRESIRRTEKSAEKKARAALREYHRDYVA